MQKEKREERIKSLLRFILSKKKEGNNITINDALRYCNKVLGVSKLTAVDYLKELRKNNIIGYTYARNIWINYAKALKMLRGVNARLD
ncbi:MAG: hypothetical protein QW253_00185 [Metallosphaera sp.]